MFGRTMGCFSMTTFVGPLVHWISWAIPGLGQLGAPPAKGPRDGLLFPVDSYFVSGTPRFRIVYQFFPYVLFPLVNQQRSSPIEESKEWPHGLQVFLLGWTFPPWTFVTWRDVTLQHSRWIALHYVTSHACTDMYVGEIVQSDIFLCFHLVDLAGKSMSKKKQPRSPFFRIPGLAGWHFWPRSLIDIPATFLDLAGAPLAPSMQGPLKGSFMGSRPQPGPWFNRLTCVVQWQSVLAFAMWIGMHPPMMFLVHRKTWVQHPEAIDIIEADRTYIYI